MDRRSVGFLGSIKIFESTPIGFIIKAMLHIAYYDSSISNFCSANESEVLGQLTAKHGFALEIQQRIAWQEQINLLQSELRGIHEGHIYFEFSIPRMGKRADTILLIAGMVFVIEFKVGASSFDRAAVDQVYDYALDLKNFHKGTHERYVLPIMIATNAPTQSNPSLSWASDLILSPICIASNQLSALIAMALMEIPHTDIDPSVWANSGYHPTPTIIEAAQALYRDHQVEEITRSDASAHNLSVTTSKISQIIEDSKLNRKKSICFVTGVPGAGKTLAGLNIAAVRAKEHSDENAVFLSGNGPLVEVLREALSRDESLREEISKKDAYRNVASFIQNIHHFRDEALKSDLAPYEKVVIFDEAQRAWGKEQASKFMQQKRGYADFDMSEPAFLISAMDRHQDWCVIVCLVGGGQEINTGEAGLSEWLIALNTQFKGWNVYLSNRLSDKDYFWDKDLSDSLSQIPCHHESDLHLSVSMRSFRADALSEFASHIIENRPNEAKTAYSRIANKYPIALTRDISVAKKWLREKARGTERYGLVASSGAIRLRPDGINVKDKIDASVWFLNDKSDIRTSYYLEEVGTEFDVQGLELDWVGIGWDADYRYADSSWTHFNFRGTNWQNVHQPERQLYLKNAYRVLLTRARQGMVIYVPTGDLDDRTRPPSFYDDTFNYLKLCGLKEN